MALLGLLVLGAGCGSTPEANEAQSLVVQLSDLPPRFRVNVAESFPVLLESVLAEPWSAAVRGVIERERLSGYQAGFTSDRGRYIQCGAAVCRSSGAAERVFTARARLFSDFVVASGGGGALVGSRLGDETLTLRYRLGRQPAATIAWRSGSILSSCTTVSQRPDAAELLVVARAQQARIASARDGAR